MSRMRIYTILSTILLCFGILDARLRLNFEKIESNPRAKAHNHSLYLTLFFENGNDYQIDARNGKLEVYEFKPSPNSVFDDLKNLEPVSQEDAKKSLHDRLKKQMSLKNLQKSFIKPIKVNPKADYQLELTKECGQFLLIYADPPYPDKNRRLKYMLKSEPLLISVSGLFTSRMNLIKGDYKNLINFEDYETDVSARPYGYTSSINNKKWVILKESGGCMLTPWYSNHDLTLLSVSFYMTLKSWYAVMHGKTIQPSVKNLKGNIELFEKQLENPGGVLGINAYTVTEKQTITSYDFLAKVNVERYQLYHDNVNKDEQLQKRNKLGKINRVYEYRNAYPMKIQDEMIHSINNFPHNAINTIKNDLADVKPIRRNDITAFKNLIKSFTSLHPPVFCNELASADPNLNFFSELEASFVKSQKRFEGGNINPYISEYDNDFFDEILKKFQKIIKKNDQSYPLEAQNLPIGTFDSNKLTDEMIRKKFISNFALPYSRHIFNFLGLAPGTVNVKRYLLPAFIMINRFVSHFDLCQIDKRYCTVDMNDYIEKYGFYPVCEEDLLLENLLKGAIIVKEADDENDENDDDLSLIKKTIELYNWESDRNLICSHILDNFDVPSIREKVRNMLKNIKSPDHSLKHLFTYKCEKWSFHRNPKSKKYYYDVIIKYKYNHDKIRIIK